MLMKLTAGVSSKQWTILINVIDLEQCFCHIRFDQAWVDKLRQTKSKSGLQWPFV
jgi:hypothetical protein